MVETVLSFLVNKNLTIPTCNFRSVRKYLIIIIALTTVVATVVSTLHI